MIGIILAFIIIIASSFIGLLISTNRRSEGWQLVCGGALVIAMLVGGLIAIDMIGAYNKTQFYNKQFKLYEEV